MTTRSACRTTHPQIRFGTCPWCSVLLLEGQPAQYTSEKAFDGRWWEIARMVADLEDGDDATRLETATNLVEHPPSLDDALGLLRKALDDPLERVTELADQALCRLSQPLSVDDLMRYEARLREDPSDLATLTIVLWIYLRISSDSDASRESRQRLLLWVIDVMPRSRIAGTPLVSVSSSMDGELYDLAKDLWLSHIQRNPRDARLIGNAAKFVTWHDELLSEELFRRCKAIEPENPEWAWHLGDLYSRWRRHRPKQPEVDWGAMSLAEYERILTQAPDTDWTLLVLPDLATAAFQAGDFATARVHGDRMLALAARASNPWRARRATHHGHLILGRVALAQGDVEQAKSRLMSHCGI